MQRDPPDTFVNVEKHGKSGTVIDNVLQKHDKVQVKLCARVHSAVTDDQAAFTGVSSPKFPAMEVGCASISHFFPIARGFVHDTRTIPSSCTIYLNFHFDGQRFDTCHSRACKQGSQRRYNHALSHQSILKNVRGTCFVKAHLATHALGP